MYFNYEYIKGLDDFLEEFNALEDDKQQVYLQNNVEDVALFIDAIKKINKSKMIKFDIAKKDKKKKNIGLHPNYSEKEIYELLNKYDDDILLKKFTYNDLLDMYISIYGSKPLSGSTKQSLIKGFRNRMHTMNRAAAFHCNQ